MVMILYLLFLFPLLLCLDLAIARPDLHKRDADFYQVRKNLTWDRSDRRKGESEKYFHEAIFHSHYDGRFGADQVPYAMLRPTLIALLQSYLYTMRSIGAETWIMHGSLLGWWWSGEIMPWDSDVDVQMSLGSMGYLASYYNMTVHTYKTSGRERDYLLEVNPHWLNGSVGDRKNVIDARWIDMDTGLFIDITTLRVDEEARTRGVEGAMMGKDRHHYLEQDIFPLRDSTFERAPAKIPFAYSDMLIEEYGPFALTDRKTTQHSWDRKKKKWVLGNRPHSN